MEPQKPPPETPPAPAAKPKPKRPAPPRDPVTGKIVRRDGTNTPKQPKPAAAAAGPDDGWKLLLLVGGIILAVLALPRLLGKRKPDAPPAAAA